MTAASRPKRGSARSGFCGATHGLGLVLLAAAVSHARPAAAYDVNPNLQVDAYFQQWFSYEQMGNMAGLHQNPSRDEASDNLSGLRLNAARLGCRVTTDDELLGVVAQVRLEREPATLLDLYGRWRPASWLSVQVGQFRIPSTFENLQDNSELDFVVRSEFADALSDYALSRTTYASSLFAGNRSYQRDLGVGLKGEVKPGGLPIRYFGMVSNGLGANIYMGGDTHREFVDANRPFHWFYGGRLELEPYPGLITLGGHASYNHHDNLVQRDNRAVLDVKRVAWSADGRFDDRRTGMRGGVAFGGGQILDDWDDNDLTDFVYHGWEWRLFWRINPLVELVAPARWLREHIFEVGFRYDVLTTESDESGVRIVRQTWTPAINYQYGEHVKLQLDWLVRKYRDPLVPNVPDNAVILSLQGKL